MKQLGLAALVLVSLVACNRQAATKVAAPANATLAAFSAAPAAPAAPSPKLAQIFTPDVIGSNVAFLETITGPAFRTDGPQLTYKVGGCTVIVGQTAGKIDNIGIDGYGPACSFPIAQYFAGGYEHPVPQLPTFGDISKGFGGAFAADCLKLCGNAADPVVSLNYQGSHADNFNNLYAAISIADDASVGAYQAWANQLGARYSDDALEQGTTTINGDTSQNFAAQAFANLRPTVIRVGSNLPGQN
jgi:hypothetical protein